MEMEFLHHLQAAAADLHLISNLYVVVLLPHTSVRTSLVSIFYLGRYEQEQMPTFGIERQLKYCFLYDTQV